MPQASPIYTEHVRKILKRWLGWTSRKPRRKARERDDKEVARWVGRLSNLAARDQDELWDRVVDELVEVKFRPDLLRRFVRQTGLPGVSFTA